MVGVMNTYLLSLSYQLQPFSLKTVARWRDGKSLGIGSSGSVVMLTKAIAALYELDLEPELLLSWLLTSSQARRQWPTGETQPALLMKT